MDLNMNYLSIKNSNKYKKHRTLSKKGLNQNMRS